MKNTFLLACLALVLAQVLCAQTPTEPLVCSGKIPVEFTTSSGEKYSKALEKISKKQAGRTGARQQKRFALESNFILDHMLQSGRVLFNDEVSLYLNEVAQKLVENKPLVSKQKIRVYALRSPAVNAFATDRGEVFVTLGLLAQLENEAQLAYILAHELTHVEKKHSMNFYLEADKIDRSKNRRVLDRSVNDDKMLAKCTFSKEQENEADRLGLERLLQTRYRTATLPVVFDVLKYSYLPFDEQPFDRSLLQSEYYRLPTDYWLEQVKPIEGAEEAADDSHDSHPNLKSRREALVSTLTKQSDTDKSDYLLSAERFRRVRDLARLELPLLYLHGGQLPQAAYTTALLLAHQPDDLSLQKSLLKALYIRAKLGNDDDYKFDGDYKEIEGESQQIFHLLEKLPAREATVLALHYAWPLQQKHPEDVEIKTITADLFFELARQYANLKEFSMLPPFDEPAPPIPTDTVQSQAPPAATSKYERIRQQKAVENTPAKSGYWRYAFVGWLDSEDFKNQWVAAQKRNDEYTEREKAFSSSKAKKVRKQQRRKGLHLGIPKVVIINPFYLKLDERKDNAVQYLSTETGQDHFRDLIRDVSTKAALKTTLLDVHDLRADQAEAFNDLRFLNEWFGDQVRHYDLTLTPGHDQERVNAIAKKYGTDYFLWTGVVSLREKNRSGYYLIPASILLFFPTLPLAIVAAVKPKYDMLHYSVLYDVRTGKRQVLKFETFNRRDADAVVKAHLYDTFVQIKRD
ncbi:MAG: M48 family metallopeptidase [Saprospiraceae bacterium]|nr:M48 family metallopeptidase [Saprospiraceae bacterium]